MIYLQTRMVEAPLLGATKPRSAIGITQTVRVAVHELQGAKQAVLLPAKAYVSRHERAIAVPSQHALSSWTPLWLAQCVAILPNVSTAGTRVPRILKASSRFCAEAFSVKLAEFNAANRAGDFDQASHRIACKV
jgi:hypothetical protein